MIYLASPYSSPDPAVREQRYESACRACAVLISAGHLVFSPIAHSHGIALYGIGGDWETWHKFDEWFITRSEMLLVLMIPGWEESKGVWAEIEFAQKLAIPPDIRFLNGGASCRFEIR